MLITHEKYNPKNIRYAFFNKKIAGSSHRYTHIHDNYKENNLLAAQVFGSEKLAIVQQKHTNKVILTNDYNNYSIADGQVTNQKNIALAVQTADCVPILLADEEQGIIGSLHSGWRGARSDIIAEGILKMKDLGAQKITALIGPCIHQDCYEVDNEFYKDFIEETNSNEQYFIPGEKESHYMFDLPGYVKDKLKKAQVHQILDINHNTYVDEENFFSYRRSTHNPDSKQGSLLSVIMLVD
jgi:polyphenol oxidase